MSTAAKSESDWNKLTVVQLKGALARRELSSDGPKQQLVERLQEHDKQQEELKAKEVEETPEMDTTEEAAPEEDAEEPPKNLLLNMPLLCGYHATVSLKTVRVEPFKRELLAQETFTSWLAECRSYDIKKTWKEETFAELKFPTIEKGDAAFEDLKANLTDVAVNHPPMHEFEKHWDVDASVGKPIFNTSLFFARLIHIQGLSAGLDTEEKLAEFFPEAVNAISFQYNRDSPGHAILEFETPFEAQQYLKSVGKEITIEDEEIKLSMYERPKEPEIDQKISGPTDKKKIFLGLVSVDLKYKDIQTHFPGCQVVFKPHTTKNRLKHCYVLYKSGGDGGRENQGMELAVHCYVLYKTEEETAAALKKNQSMELNGRKLRLSYAVITKTDKDNKDTDKDKDKEDKDKSTEEGEAPENEKRLEMNKELRLLSEELLRIPNSDELDANEKRNTFQTKMERFHVLRALLNQDTNRRLRMNQDLPESEDEMWSETKQQIKTKKSKIADDQEEVVSSLDELDMEYATMQKLAHQLMVRKKRLEQVLSPAEKKKRMERINSGEAVLNTPIMNTKKALELNRLGGGLADKTGGGIRGGNRGSDRGGGRGRAGDRGADRAGNRGRGTDRFTPRGGAGRGGGRTSEWKSPPAEGYNRKRLGSTRSDYNESPSPKYRRGGSTSGGGRGSGPRSRDTWNYDSERRDSYSGRGPRDKSLIHGLTNALSEKMKQLEQLQEATIQTQQQLMGGGYGGVSGPTAIGGASLSGGYSTVGGSDYSNTGYVDPSMGSYGASYTGNSAGYGGSGNSYSGNSSYQASDYKSDRNSSYRR